MALPDRTLCWVEGPPWDRNCEPVEPEPRSGSNLLDVARAVVAVFDASGDLHGSIQDLRVVVEDIDQSRARLDEFLRPDR